jgi:serine phosphatase RsbU (regulator of sigma subunit)
MRERPKPLVRGRSQRIARRPTFDREIIREINDCSNDVFDVIVYTTRDPVITSDFARRCERCFRRTVPIKALNEKVARLEGDLAAKQTVVDALMEGYLTTEFPVVDGLSFDVLYEPAAELEQLGGDWYDVFVLPDGRVAFSLGDVCGKGIGSAVKMGQAKQAIKVAASLQINDPRPIAVLDQANKVIFLNGHHVEFTTAIYGFIDVKARLVTYASAGHHPPILARAGRPSKILPNHGFALGVENVLPDLIHEHSFSSRPGDLLVLYTDGLIEFNHDMDDGEQRLLLAARDAVENEAVRPARFIVESVLQPNHRRADDVAVLTISFR